MIKNLRVDALPCHLNPRIASLIYHCIWKTLAFRHPRLRHRPCPFDIRRPTTEHLISSLDHKRIHWRRTSRVLVKTVVTHTVFILASSKIKHNLSPSPPSPPRPALPSSISDPTPETHSPPRMALFKKLKGSNNKSTPDLKQVIDSNQQEEVALASTKEARASRSTDNLRTTPPQSPTRSQPETPSPGVTPRKTWVPKQRGLVPQPAIPYRHVPSHAASDAFRTLQGRGEKPSNYWQNLGVFPRGGRQPPRRSHSSSEISTGSIDSVLCSCAALKADDGYYHPLLASEMRHCNHSPIRKMRQGSSRGSSTTSMFKTVFISFP